MPVIILIRAGMFSVGAEYFPVIPTTGLTIKRFRFHHAKHALVAVFVAPIFAILVSHACTLLATCSSQVSNAGEVASRQETGPGSS